jgi:uncharacterized protein (TIGR02246 family)
MLIPGASLLKWGARQVTVTVVSACALGGAMLTAQGGQALTPRDHVEIQQLVARYSHALDSGADNGNTLASLFTPDGVLTAEDGKVYSGRTKLAEYARGNAASAKGPANVRHFSYKAIIDPVPDGATGKTLVTFASIGRSGEAATNLDGGRYWDDFVKTSDGWRIKKRTYVPGARPNRPAPARAAG